jgi:hypothetical protein
MPPLRRRQFLGTLAALPVAAMEQEGPPVSDPVEKMTAPARPAIAINHLGFRPHAEEKCWYWS